VPSRVPLEDVRRAILSVDGVLSVHELHIWSLSESKVVASTHVLIADRKDYVEVSERVRSVLHRFGIHSSTIQPEIVQKDEVTGTVDSVNGKGIPSDIAELTDGSVDGNESACLLQCVGGEACVVNACESIICFQPYVKSNFL
jgi:zinc transporter 1